MYLGNFGVLKWLLVLSSFLGLLNVVVRLWKRIGSVHEDRMAFSFEKRSGFVSLALRKIRKICSDSLNYLIF